jgi:cell wall-associated NlpC family hydrolase
MRTIALWACLLSASVSFGNTVKVKAGDTIEKIASRTGVSASQIRKANPGIRETRLQIGQVIKLSTAGSRTSAGKSSSGKKRGGGNHTVQAGENNWTIAKRYGVSVSELSALNGGRDLARIKPGEKLTVPGRTVAKKTATKPVAKPVAKSTKPASKPVASKPATSGSKPITAKYIRVRGDDVSVRKNPTTDSSRVARAQKDDYGKVLKSQGNWYYIQFNQYAGWIRRDFVAGISTGELTALQASAGQRAVARKAAAEEAKVALANKPAPKPAAKGSNKNADALISSAKDLIGTRYVWGGTSRGGFDCSGFVGYVMRKAGVSLPRTSAAQAKVGTFVPRSSLQRGDLVFFNTRGGRISHVGIYIGSGNFIHASSGGGRVRIDALSKAYYNTRYVTARRVGKFTTVSGALDEVRIELEESGELPKTVDAPEAKVQPGTDEVIK